MPGNRLILATHSRNLIVFWLIFHVTTCADHPSRVGGLTLGGEGREKPELLLSCSLHRTRLQNDMVGVDSEVECGEHGGPIIRFYKTTPSQPTPRTGGTQSIWKMSDETFSIET